LPSLSLVLARVVVQLRSSLLVSSLRPSLLSFRSMASFTIPVPPVADSISEGTLATLSVTEGAAVAVAQVSDKGRGGGK